MSLPRHPAPPPDYRPGVGIMLFDRRSLVFVARRIDTPGEAWQMPQGGIDPGEDPQTAALRELEEEAGTAHAEIVAETNGWLAYDLPPEIRGRIWGGRYRGQAQKWFAARFLGTDSEIDIHKHEHSEFSDWRWAPPGDLPRLIVGFKRALYEQVVAELGPHLIPVPDRA